MEYHSEFLEYLFRKGGPDAEDFYDMDAWIADMAEKSATVSASAKKLLIELFGDAFSTQTMQGFAYVKPHGYAGDYEIIDRIYNRYVSPQQHLSKWDVYWQSHAAAEAVRNRVGYFCEQMASAKRRAQDRTIRVLNLASGPGRDMVHFFENFPDSRGVFIDCVEQDAEAIEYAKTVCADFLDNIQFIKRNVLRFEAKNTYDLIWSAGLFDYFDDKVFVFLLKRLKKCLSPVGELVVGNFSTINPSKPYMELFEWRLNHRSPQLLKHLAISAGFDPVGIYIGREKTGVNLFLHARLTG